MLKSTILKELLLLIDSIQHRESDGGILIGNTLRFSVFFDGSGNVIDYYGNVYLEWDSLEELEKKYKEYKNDKEKNTL